MFISTWRTSTYLLLALSSLLVLFTSGRAAAQSNEYISRGGYSEGTKAEPKTGPTLIWKAVLVDPREPNPARLPARFKALFYLPEGTQVARTGLEIQETDSPRYYYNLGDVKETWTPGVNEFGWSTSTVVQKLNYDPAGPLRLSDLGAIVRLGNSGRGGFEEWVAPVVLYSTHAPAIVQGYRFAVEPSMEMKLIFRVYQGDRPVSKAQTFPQAWPGDTQSFTWQTGDTPDGWYRLQVQGTVISGNEQVEQVLYQVHFYHSRRLGR